MWFERLTGFPETSPDEVRCNLTLAGDQLSSVVNGRTWTWGFLEVVSLAELRKRSLSRPVEATGCLTLKEEVANVQDLHRDPANAGALFQVASQFNLLEMVSPSVTPEEGVGIYGNDFTQGPACAIAAGAGTIFRNYFAEVNGRVGQTEDNQLDCLADIGRLLGNTRNKLWTMRNGYALATADGLEQIESRLQAAGEQKLDAIRAALKVGVQRDTQVTLDSCSHLVTQCYCSALPVAYSPHPKPDWKDFAVLILEASYEATLRAATLNAERNQGSRGRPKVFLTLLGGGAFGNPTDWILAAIDRALRIHQGSNLDVRIVSYGSPNPSLRVLLDKYGA